MMTANIVPHATFVNLLREDDPTNTSAKHRNKINDSREIIDLHLIWITYYDSASSGNEWKTNVCRDSLCLLCAYVIVGAFLFYHLWQISR